MDSFIRTLSKPSKLIAMILLFMAAGLSVIADAAGLGGSFMPVVGKLILLLFNMTLWAIIPLLMILKKDRLVSYAIVPVFGYWLISTIYNYLGNSMFITDEYASLSIAHSLFQFFIGCAFLGIIALGILFFFTKKRLLLQIAFCLLAGSLLFYLLVCALSLAMFPQWNADWRTYFYAFVEYLLIPTGLTFVVLNSLTATAPAKTPQPIEEAQEQEKTDVCDSETNGDIE